MSEEILQSVEEHRRLVQRILEGGIPEGKDFDACRAVLKLGTDHDETFMALFTLLQGALSDPFFGIDETQQVVPILRALSRREIGVRELL